MRPKTMRRKRRGLLQTRPAFPVGAHRGHAQHQVRPGGKRPSLPLSWEARVFPALHGRAAAQASTLRASGGQRV